MSAPNVRGPQHTFGFIPSHSAERLNGPPGVGPYSRRLAVNTDDRTSLHLPVRLLRQRGKGWSTPACPTVAHCSSWVSGRSATWPAESPSRSGSTRSSRWIFGRAAGASARPGLDVPPSAHGRPGVHSAEMPLPEHQREATNDRSNGHPDRRSAGPSRRVRTDDSPPKDQDRLAHLPSARSTAAPVRPMSAGPSLPAFEAARSAAPRASAQCVVLDVGRHVTARLGDEVKLLDHTRSLRRRADRQPSRHHWVDCPGCGGSVLYVRHPPVASWQGWCRPGRSPATSRSKRDDAVIGRVALGRNATDGRRKSAPPAVGHRRQGRRARAAAEQHLPVRNRGTGPPNPLMGDRPWQARPSPRKPGPTPCPSRASAQVRRSSRSWSWPASSLSEPACGRRLTSSARCSWSSPW